MNWVSRLRSSERRRVTGAFTLTELFVMLAAICVLGILLLPAFGATQDRSNRALCQSHLRQIAIVVTQYAAENNDTLPTVSFSGSTFVQNVLNPYPRDRIGITASYPSSSNIWTCPNRPGLPVLETSPNQWVIGYQYFGGISNWKNPAGTFTARSPVKLTQAKPFWTLAADAVMKVNNAWGGNEPGRTYVYENIPPHRTSDAVLPQGGNQVFTDGSVQWIDFEQMYYLTSWSSTRACFFYQNQVDFDATLKPVLPILKAHRYY